MAAALPGRRRPGLPLLSLIDVTLLIGGGLKGLLRK